MRNVVILGMGMVAGFSMFLAARPKDRLREHARLIRKAARASRRGRDGEAMVLHEAAKRVLDEPPK